MSKYYLEERKDEKGKVIYELREKKRPTKSDEREYMTLEKFKDKEIAKSRLDFLREVEKEDKEEQMENGKKKIKLTKKLGKEIKKEQDKAKENLTFRQILTSEKMKTIPQSKEEYDLIIHEIERLQELLKQSNFSHKKKENTVIPDKKKKVKKEKGEKKEKGSGLVPKEKITIPEEIFSKLPEDIQSLVKENIETGSKKSRRELRKVGFYLSKPESWDEFIKEEKKSNKKAKKTK